MKTSNETLAIDGGEPVRREPLPPRRLFGEEEKRAVIALFDESIARGEAFGYQADMEKAFTDAFAAELGGGYADGVNSGTNAVYLALRSLDLEPGDEVIVPPITDAGGVMPVAILNCVPVVADSAPGSFNTSAEQVAARMTERTRAILVAHIAGIPADMDPILKLAGARGIPVVEDCAQALGATYKGRSVGSLGAASAFSTMFGKHIATGGQGGVVFTKDEQRYWKIRRAADRGKPFNLPDAGGNVVASLNFNMDEIHATIGTEQLRKLPNNIRQRRRLAGAIAQGCAERLKTIRLVTDPEWGTSSYWFLFFRIELGALKVDKDRFTAAVTAEGMQAIPTYLYTPAASPWFQARRAFGTSGLPWTSGPSVRRPTSPDMLPNVYATDAVHFSMRIHEQCDDREVNDILDAFEKVERAYAR